MVAFPSRKAIRGDGGRGSSSLLSPSMEVEAVRLCVTASAFVSGEDGDCIFTKCSSGGGGDAACGGVASRTKCGRGGGGDAACAGTLSPAGGSAAEGGKSNEGTLGGICTNSGDIGEGGVAGGIGGYITVGDSGPLVPPPLS